MENNKYYLQRMPAIYLIAGLFGVLYVLLPHLASYSFFPKREYVIQGVFFLYEILFFLSLGFLSRNWPAAMAGLAAGLLFHIGGLFIFKSGFTVIQFLYFQLASILPMLVFFFIVHKNPLPPGKLLLTILLLIVVNDSYINIPYYLTEGTTHFFTFTIKVSSVWYKLLVFTGITFPFLIQLLFITEISNYHAGKGPSWKPRVLNLGNEYPQGGSIPILVILNIWMAMTLFQGYEMMQANFYYSDRPPHFASVPMGGILASLIKHAVTHIPFLLLYGWYYRKFLLEYFINYGHSSKFLYWLCFVPVIGAIALLIAAAAGEHKKTYTGKSGSLSAFASSNSDNVLAILSVLLIIRLLLNISEASTGMIVSGILSVVFLFFISSSKGFLYFCLGLNIAALAGITIFSFYGHEERGNPWGIIYGLVSVNIVSLIMLLPVFHIYSFEFIPDQDPAGAPVDGDLFPEYSRHSS